MNGREIFFDSSVSSSSASYHKNIVLHREPAISRDGPFCPDLLDMHMALTYNIKYVSKQILLEVRERLRVREGEREREIEKERKKER